MEFNDENIVKKILHTPFVRLQGIELSISKVSRHLSSLLSSTNDDDDDDEVQTIEPKRTVSEPLPIQNQPPLVVLPLIHQENTLQQQLLSFINSIPPPLAMEPILIPSPE